MSLPACACGHPIPSEAAARRHVKECPGQGLPAGWTLDDYTRLVQRARDAYNADRLRDEGLCVVCGVNRSKGSRVCQGCRERRRRTQ